MTIKNNMTYEPKLKELKKESDIYDLLSDVKSNLGIFDEKYYNKSLIDILSIVETGECNIPDQRKEDVYDSIYLSKAKYFIGQYKYNSEGGCQSCQEIRRIKPLQDETISYCNLDDNGENAIKRFAKDTSTMQSSTIQKYFEKGCDKRKPIFRPLEEVLKDY